MHRNINILITASVDVSGINNATNNITVDIIPFIQTKTIQSSHLSKQIKNISKLTAVIVFTSQHAVEALKDYIDRQTVNWKIYCTANATKKLVEKTFGLAAVVGAGNNANEIAEKIIQDNIASEIYFFCGDKKRDELPSLLQQKNILVHELEVYHTEIIHHSINKLYDGILFFSPSAVKGFFASNKIGANTVLFAIGQTTASEIKNHSKNKVVISHEPDKLILVNKAVKYLSDN